MEDTKVDSQDVIPQKEERLLDRSENSIITEIKLMVMLETPSTRK